MDYSDRKRDTLRYTVAAVFKDFPENSHEEFSIFVSFDRTSVERLGFDAGKTGLYGRSLHSDLEQLTSRVASLVNSGDLLYSAQPLPEIYFGPRVSGEDSSHGDSYSVFILICITALILFLAPNQLCQPYYAYATVSVKGVGRQKISRHGPGGFVLYFCKGIIARRATLISLWHAATAFERGVDRFNAFDRCDFAADGRRYCIIFGDGRSVGNVTVPPLFLIFRFIKASPNRHSEGDSTIVSVFFGNQITICKGCLISWFEPR